MIQNEDHLFKWIIDDLKVGNRFFNIDLSNEFILKEKVATKLTFERRK